MKRKFQEGDKVLWRNRGKAIHTVVGMFTREPAIYWVYNQIGKGPLYEKAFEEELSPMGTIEWDEEKI